MKQKFYSMYGTAVDRFGEEHIVTIVGEYTQEKVETEVTKEVDMEDDFKPTRMVKAKITYPTKIKVRTLNMLFQFVIQMMYMMKKLVLKLLKNVLMKNLWVNYQQL